MLRKCGKRNEVNIWGVEALPDFVNKVLNYVVSHIKIIGDSPV